MPWVPIQSSDFAGDVTLDGGVIDNGASYSFDAFGQNGNSFFSVQTPEPLPEPALFRISFQSYLQSEFFETADTPPYIQADSVTVSENEGAAPDFSPWTPSPVEGGFIQEFSIHSAHYPESTATVTSNFVVEVWEDEPAEISYNCECDDQNPSRTLSELRTELMRRLGFSAMTASPPPGMPELLNSFLQGAQRQLYRTYRALRTERFYTWQLLQGVRYYDLDANEDVCTKKLDPRMITWVGISDNTDWWQPLICGIPPECYSWNQTQGWPQRYEIRQCIEVWPAPDGNENWKLRIKGHFGLEPFEADGDQCTIDDEAVFLFALARAKAHYTQPDAANYQTDAMNYIKNLTAGAHMTRRYVPGTVESASPVPPKFIPKNY